MAIMKAGWMTAKTESVVSILLKLADYLEFLGENRFKVLAYRRGARAIEQSERDIEELHASGELSELPGIGDAILKKVAEILATGRLHKLDELEAQIPAPVREMLDKLPTAPTKVHCLVAHGIDSMGKLEAAAQSHELETISELGRKATDKILKYFAI